MFVAVTSPACLKRWRDHPHIVSFDPCKVLVCQRADQLQTGFFLRRASFGSKKTDPIPYMYQHYFGFNKSPFSIAPDPHNVYMSLQHREALAHLLFGVTAGGGFVLLTGEIGTGKTTMCRCLLEQLPPTCDVAFIFNPKLTALDLLLTISHELRIDLGAAVKSTKTLVECINAHLLHTHASGRNTLLIIDEAQNLPDDVLEQMHLLTNLETDERKLLQIILIGQPELRQKLARPELAHLAQRIIARPAQTRPAAPSFQRETNLASDDISLAP
jgi:type II secretory pathway predicted ATPase ExeA